MLISLFVPVVSADEVYYINDSEINVVGDGFTEFVENYNSDDYDIYIQTMIDLVLEQTDYDLSKDYIFAVYSYETDLAYIYNFYYVVNGTPINIIYDGDVTFYNTYINRCGYSIIKSTSAYSNVSVDSAVGTQRIIFDNDNEYKYDSKYVFLPPERKKLKFTVNPLPTMNLDLNTLPSTFTITVENETDVYYDYMIYISEKPSNIGIINSFNQSRWFMSSKQWCYQWLQDYSALNGNINDYIADNIADGLKGADILDYTFGNGMYNSLFNAWGGAFDGAKEYFSVDDETMSFYQVSQTNCPVYRINPNDTKTHTISYSSLNLELGKTYYLNIIYTPADFKVYSAMTTPIVDAGTGQQGNYPVFDTRNIAKYSVYDSYEFSVSNGVFSQDSNTLYSYSDLIKYTNPSNSVAKIESDDDEIIVSDNDSYDNSVSTSYINYGQIYHGCTFYNGAVGGSGGSGGLVEENIELKIYGVDDLDFELTQLSGPVSKFQQFMQSVFGFLPPEMVGLFILGISTCIICRILGR